MTPLPRSALEFMLKLLFIEVKAKLQQIEVKLKKHKLIWNTVQDFANRGAARGGVQVGHTAVSADFGGASIHIAVI